MVNVSIANVSKQYGITPVITDMTLSVEPGDLFFLLGPSGCGKTTLLRMIAGFTEPTAGTIMFGERNMRGVPPHRRNTGMVFQNFALWPHLTVEQNVAFGLDVRGFSREDKKRMTTDALTLVRMNSYAQRYPHQLSGGQQQRVALARALVVRPDVVLLDEPLSNLDAGLRIEMRKEIHRIHHELGFTMIYVTHDQKEALSLATKLALMNCGVMIQVDTPAQMYQNPSSVFAAQFVGETNILHGRVTRNDKNVLAVDLLSGALLCPTARAAREYVAGSAVTVSIRPEGLHLTPDPQGANVWPCVIAETTYLGEVIQLVCRTRDAVLRMTMLNTAGAHPRPGDKRHVSVNPAHVRILDAE